MRMVHRADERLFIDYAGPTDASMTQALAFYGRVPRLIGPDNSRALVTRAERYEPLLTDSMQDKA